MIGPFTLRGSSVNGTRSRGRSDFLLIISFFLYHATIIQLPDAGRYDLDRALNVYLWRGQFIIPLERQKHS